MFKSGSFIVLTLAALPALATNPVIYGEDHRQEVYESTALNQKLAGSAATMIGKEKLTRSSEKPGLVQVDQTTLRQWLESQFGEQKSALLSNSAQDAVDQRVTFCANERFTEQPNAGMCSGFLVGPDLLVTAGHCSVITNFCEKFDWVFDFKVDADSKTAGVDVKEENIYSCKKVISQALSTGLGLDYALVQLDRKVKGRESLTLRTEGMVSVKTPLVVIGSPSGLPLKVSAGAAVRTNNHPFYFAANLDTFQGNSGSAVFNAESGVVEGILVRGEEDFEANTSLMCIEAKRCDDSACRGEDVSRMTSIPEYAVKDALMKLAAKGDVKELEKLSKTKFWIDIYGKDGKTALMVSVDHTKDQMVQELLKKGADVKIQDAEGNSSLHVLAQKLSRKSSDLLKVLIEAGAPLEAKNALGETALLVAARNLNLDGVKLLIKNGVAKNALDNNGENAIFAFARKGDKRAVKELAELGVDSSIRNASGIAIEEIRKKKVRSSFGK